MRITLFFLSTLFSFILNAQTNLIPNSSFESGSPNNPTVAGELGALSNWQEFETSDWYSSNTSYYYGTYDITGATAGYGLPAATSLMLAHLGEKFIGFGPCEGAQVEMSSSPKINDIVTVSFWFSPRTKEDTEINVYLLEDNASNDALGNHCTNPDIEYEFTDKIIVNSSGTNAIHTPGTWYYYQSKPFVIKSDVDYKWFAIKGRNVAGKLTSREYVYVDDVKVTKTPVCYSICPGDLPKPTFQMLQSFPNTLVNAMIGNTLSNWFMTVEDATYIDFEIFSNASQSWFEYHAFDPNGLKDPGYPDYAFQWNGEDNNGNTVQFGIYNYNLTIGNCNDKWEFIAQPLLIFPAQSTPIQHPPTQYHWLESCCKPNATFNNITFQNGFREDVDDFINAGLGGPTIVPSNATVEFYAGNTITLGNGFQTNGDFIADIVPCATYDQVSRVSERRGYASQETLDSLLAVGKTEYGLTLDQEKSIEVFPNPSKGLFNVRFDSNVNSEILIEVYDLLSKKVFERKYLSSNTVQVDLSNLEKGIYYMKIVSDGTTYKEKIINQ